MQEICGFLYQTTDIILGGALGINPWQFEVLICFATAMLGIVSRKIKFLSCFSSLPPFYLSYFNYCFFFSATFRLF